MKPKIKTRITNLIAKLAGSSDYEPGIQPKEPIEFYLSDAIDGILNGAIGVTPLGVVTATGQMTTAQKKATRDNIGAVGSDELGSVLTFKGSVATIADLPSENNSVGDVYFVDAELANFVWIVDETFPNGFWDEFGQPIDLSLYQLKPVVEVVTGASPSITPVANKVYECGELTSLTIANPPATGAYVIKFDSGSTATTTTIPATIKGLESFAPEANTHYEINVEDNYALVASWAVSV